MTQYELIVSYDDQLHKSILSQDVESELTIGNSLSNDVTFEGLIETISVNWNGDSCMVNDRLLEMNDYLEFTVEQRTMKCYLIALDPKSMYVFDCTSALNITIGHNAYDDVQIADTTIDLVFTRNDITSPFQLNSNNGEVFHNLSKVNEETVVDVGDHLFFDGVKVTIGNSEIQFISPDKEILSNLVSLNKSTSVYDEEYPNYHRSPRIIYREPEEKKVIAKPSAKPTKPSEQLMRTIIPPLVMIGALAVVSIFQPRGIFIIVMLAMTVTTVILSVTSYIKSSKQYRIDMKERTKSYKQYLKTKTKELFKATEEQRHALNYHFPSVSKIKEMAKEVDARIYEKTMFHHDFLHYRVGLGNIDTSFEIDFNEEEFTQEKDDLVKEARHLHRRFKKMESVPITASLMNGPVGYIGQRTLVLEQLQLMVMQTAFFHSYHELQFIVIFPEEEKSEWEWMRWLPHARLKDLNVRGFVYHERSRDQVLTSLYQILKERKLYLSEQDSREKHYFTPHYVVLITDEKIVLDHTIMEFFNEDPRELGVSLVFVQDVLQSLPEHVDTVIDIRDSKSGNVLLEEGELVNQAFIPDHFPSHFNKEDISRSLAPLNHLQSLKSSIPEAVTFLEMYGVERVEEFNLREYWAQNETYKTLAVPLGLRAKDDIVYLNLHEKAHGPHGLVAGTTGSGKSEIIQSYILSLAINFHPYEVAFLLIDYKGGGMANLFKDLPHSLGAITNLDGAQSMRALASIKAELKKRQRLFGEHDVNHINQYQKLYKQGETSDPMPHLFLISDEFAELKAEQPDFMKELVSTARIGRSLGIHLILATQKPTGVVDDQIWSNSKFKLALKVQDAGDSNEILKTPDAAEITLPGRAYLQVGNNEIYELFQSAWSGADYKLDKDDPELVDTTLYAINELGQYDILTKDLSGLDKKEEIEKTKTELEAIIDYIDAFTKEQHIKELPSPWLPPLETNIFAPDLCARDFKENWTKEKEPLRPIIGLGDFPDEQDQRVLEIPLTKDGHLAVFSSPGYGKSTFIQTVVLDLARVHSPKDFHVYLLDFGTNGLLPLKDLPHIADILLIDENEKVEKLIRRLEAEIKDRKRLLSQYGVATMDMYEKASGKTVPHILLAIDNYDAVREADFVESFERSVTQIAREGGSIGIHLIISGSRQNVMRMALHSNIKTQISLFLIDDLETRSIVGRTQLEIEEIPGRGLIKLEEPTVFQTALPNRGEDTLQVIEGIQSEAKEMDAFWDGERPEEIPMMPDGVIEFNKYKEMKATKKLLKKNMLPLGLDFEDVSPLPFDFNKYGHLIAVGDRLDRIEKVQIALGKNMTLLKEVYKTMLLDSPEQKLEKIGEQLDAYITQPDQLVGLKNDLLSEVKYRVENKTDEPKWLIMIANFKDFCQQSMITNEEMTSLMGAAKFGIHLIMCSEYSYLGQSYEQIPKFVRSQALAGLVNMRLGDQDIFKQRFISNEKSPEAYECYFAMDHQHVKIKIPK
ncbi:type VII secretion protein EssC [Pseudogracilibacillus sp. SE30717A]|uniref:type VII secretion protein EssC n=1 Tax=Pseudogracilibacillus sp. SE30717A TaxID=3098293 RepID=UPI00300E60CD